MLLKLSYSSKGGESSRFKQSLRAFSSFGKLFAMCLYQNIKTIYISTAVIQNNCIDDYTGHVGMSCGLNVALLRIASLGTFVPRDINATDSLLGPVGGSSLHV